MNLLYSPDFSEQHPILSGPEAHHALNVLRYGPGDRLHLTNGAGKRYDVTIQTVGKGECRLMVDQTVQTAREPAGIHLGVGIMKNSDRMEWMVEKLTETGITSLTFLLTSNVERKTINLERLHKAAISAIKQSGRLWIPELHGPVKFSDLITKPFGGRHIASAGHKETPRLIDRISTPGDHLVLIGPEGDFSTAEFNLALVNGFHPVSLGGATLRTETAAFHACVAMNLAIGRS